MRGKPLKIMDLEPKNSYISVNKNGSKRCANTYPSLTTQPNMEAVMADSKVSNSTKEEKEVWREIPGFEGYEVSNYGKVRSWRIPGPGNKVAASPKIMKLDLSNAGYYRITLRDEDRNKIHFSIHRLVAELFIPNPKNKPQVNHKDGNKKKNWASNLEWVTRSENQKHGHENGLMNPPKGKEHWNTHLDKDDVLEIRRLYETGEYYQYEIAEMYDVCRVTITNIVNRKNWAHV